MSLFYLNPIAEEIAKLISSQLDARWLSVQQVWITESGRVSHVEMLSRVQAIVAELKAEGKIARSYHIDVIRLCAIGDRLKELLRVQPVK